MWGGIQRELRLGLVVCLLAAIVIIVFSPFVDLPPALNKKGRPFIVLIRRFSRLLLPGSAVTDLGLQFGFRLVPVPHVNPARVLLC